jgi:hypothetical protein
MTAFAAVTLDDSASAAVVFSPSTIDPNGVAHRYSPETSGFDSRNHLSLGVRLPKNGSAVARVTAKVVVPVMDETDASLKVGDALCNIEFVIPKRGTALNRADLLAYVQEYLADASVIAAVTNLESVY